MTGLIIKLFVKNNEETDNPKVRANYGSVAGMTGIVCNIILFVSKLAIGLLSKSVSITADAVNNLADASSSIMTILGFKLSQKPPDEEHPYGHARMEYLSGLAVAALIMVIGYQLAKSSIDKIIHPEKVEFSAALVTVLILSIFVKLWMAYFNMKIGRIIGSKTLIATAADSRNDVISTTAVLISAVAAYSLDINLDGIMGLVVAIFILFSSMGIAKDTISPLLGEPADEELVKLVYNETLNFDERVLGVHDLMVHDYGPGQRFASEHVEVDSRENVIDIHEMIDDIEKMFYSKHNIHMVIHYDPIVTDDEEVNRMRAFVEEQIKKIDERLMMHDFRIVRGNEHSNLIFDLAVPYALQGKEKSLQKQLDELVQQEGMKYYTVITFDLY